MPSPRSRRRIARRHAARRLRHALMDLAAATAGPVDRNDLVARMKRLLALQLDALEERATRHLLEAHVRSGRLPIPRRAVTPGRPPDTAPAPAPASAPRPARPPGARQRPRRAPRRRT